MLNIYIGSMYSGKTTELINNFYRFRKYNQLVIDYYTEQNNSVVYHKDKLYNHSKDYIDCIKTNNIHYLLKSDNLNEIKVIHINEAQFFTNLKEIVIYLVDTLNINVYLYGLDGDFKREKFGEILDLIPYCNNITKLKGVCNNCDSDALFSHRIVDSKEQYLVNNENENTYIPLCRKCYLNEINK